MPDFSVKAENFSIPFTHLNVTNIIAISKRRFLKNAISNGLPSFATFSRSPSYAVALASYKACAIKCAIDFSGTTLTRRRGYGRLDQSEKANISYWTGMTFASIIANDLLNVPHMIHATSFKPSNIPRKNPKSRSLADLIGKDNNGRWHVIEAKARQQAPSDKIRDSWKAQAGTISLIKGQPPATCSYCLTNIRRHYSAELVDPPSDSNALGNNIEFEIHELVQWYYGPLMEWLSSSAPHVNIIGDNTKSLLRLATYDPSEDEFVYFGMTEKAHNFISDKKQPFYGQSLETDNAYIGSDGIVVLTSKQRSLE